MIAAIPITTSKFGPSGSLKNKNSALEHKIAVIPKISKEICFDLKYIFVIILKNVLAARQGLEPQLTASKAAVLPLDDRAKYIYYQVLHH